MVRFSWAAGWHAHLSTPWTISVTSKHVNVSWRQSQVTKQQAFEQGCWHELNERAKQLHPSNLITLPENLVYWGGTGIAGSFIKLVLCVEVLSARSDFLIILMGIPLMERYDACLTVTAALTSCTRNTARETCAYTAQTGSCYRMMIGNQASPQSKVFCRYISVNSIRPQVFPQWPPWSGGGPSDTSDWASAAGAAGGGWSRLSSGARSAGDRND